MEGMRGHMQVSARRLEVPMAEQELDPPEIHPRFEEMCRKGVTKHMWMDHLREVRRLPGMPADQIHGLGGHRARAGWPGKSQGCGLACRPYCRNNGSNFGESMTYRSC